jgi:hypothetical protein
VNCFTQSEKFLPGPVLYLGRAVAAQMQKSADKAVAAVSVIITGARPVAVVGKILEHQVESCTPCAIWPSGIGLSAPDPGNEPILARAAVHPAEKR